MVPTLGMNFKGTKKLQSRIWREYRSIINMKKKKKLKAAAETANYFSMALLAYFSTYQVANILKMMKEFRKKNCNRLFNHLFLIPNTWKMCFDINSFNSLQICKLLQKNSTTPGLILAPSLFNLLVFLWFLFSGAQLAYKTTAMYFCIVSDPPN